MNKRIIIDKLELLKHEIDALDLLDKLNDPIELTDLQDQLHEAKRLVEQLTLLLDLFE